MYVGKPSLKKMQRTFNVFFLKLQPTTPKLVAHSFMF